MRVKIKQIDNTLPLPKYETEGSVGFDFVCREDCDIEAGYMAGIPSNVIIETPPDYMLMVVSRGSTPVKRGLVIPNAIGVIDQDFCGNDDEIIIQVWNISNETVHVKRGDRIAQGIFVIVGIPAFDVVDDMGDESRGGFGSTGENIHDKIQSELGVDVARGKDELVEELKTADFKIGDSDKIAIESKDDIPKRIGKSQDMPDR